MKAELGADLGANTIVRSKSLSKASSRQTDIERKSEGVST